MENHCSSTIPYTIRHIKITWLLGCIFCGVAYGVLMLLGVACVNLLRTQGSRSPRVNKALKVYVVLVIVAGTVAEVMDITVTINGVLDNTCGSDFLQPPNPYMGYIDVVFLIINLLTDGLLVWRCYAITRSLKGRALSVLWLVPLSVYAGMIVTGITLTIVFVRSSQRGGIGDILILVQFGVSALLNALITLSITALLVQHRQMVSKALGKHNPLPYLSIFTYLVESAAFILLVDMFAIITIPLSPVGNIAFQLWVHSQPIASLMIIYRVARNADYFSNKGEAITNTLSLA